MRVLALSFKFMNLILLMNFSYCNIFSCWHMSLVVFKVSRPSAIFYEPSSAINSTEIKILWFTSHVIHILIPQVVVFFSTCDAVDFHYSVLSEFHFSTYQQSEGGTRDIFLGCKTLRLHGNMEQEDRTTSFHAFKTEKSALLLSTDVSARGLDFPKVRCIIQYDSPGEATEYVHRYLLFLLAFSLIYFSGAGVVHMFH